MGRLFTIGHSTHDIDFFVSLLKKFEIEALVDIRSTPYSKMAQQFNQEGLKNYLRKNNIIYIYMGDLLGARYSDSNFLDENFIVDFEKVFKKDTFLKGIARLYDGLSKNFSISIMSVTNVFPTAIFTSSQTSLYLSINIGSFLKPKYASHLGIFFATKYNGAIPIPPPTNATFPSTFS